MEMILIAVVYGLRYGMELTPGTRKPLGGKNNVCHGRLGPVAASVMVYHQENGTVQIGHKKYPERRLHPSDGLMESGQGLALLKDPSEPGILKREWEMIRVEGGYRFRHALTDRKTPLYIGLSEEGWLILSETPVTWQQA